MAPLDPDYVERELDRLDRRLIVAEQLPVKFTGIEVELAGIKADLGKLTKSFEQHVRDRVREREIADRDRKSDRRWMIGAVVSTGGLVTAALALIVNAPPT